MVEEQSLFTVGALPYTQIFIVVAHLATISTFQGENKDADSQSVTMLARTQTQQTSRAFVVSATKENINTFSPARKVWSRSAQNNSTQSQS